MSSTSLLLAPPHEAACVIAYLALHSSVPAPALEEIRTLLATTPPGPLANTLEQAYMQLSAEGNHPSGPELAAYWQLIFNLRHLAEVTELTFHSQAA